MKKNCKEQSKALDLFNGWEITSARIPRQATASNYFPNYYSGEWTESGKIERKKRRASLGLALDSDLFRVGKCCV